MTTISWNLYTARDGFVRGTITAADPERVRDGELDAITTGRVSFPSLEDAAAKIRLGDEGGRRLVILNGERVRCFDDWTRLAAKGGGQ